MTTDQLHLLRAALCPPDEALAHWQAWCHTRLLNRRVPAFECCEKSTEPTYYHLLPLVYENLSHTNEARVAALASSYQATQRHNEQVIKLTHSVQEALSNAHLDVVLPGSLPLAVAYYPTLSLRKIDDLTIWVRIQDLNRTLSVLEVIGFRSTTQAYEPEQLPLTFHLTGPRQFSLCVQGHGLSRQPAIGTDVLCSPDKTTLALPTGLPFRTLSTPQLLLQTLASSYQPGPAVLGWIPDSLMLLRQNAPDWSRVLGLTERYGLSVSVQRGLGMLHRHFDVTIPPTIRQRLRQLVTTKDIGGQLPFENQQSFSLAFQQLLAHLTV